MTALTPSKARRVLLAGCTVLLALAVAGCSAPPVSGTLPGADPGSEQVEQTCEVGHWTLDIPHYEAQVREYFQSLNLPIEGYVMTGSGELDIATDGFISATTEMRSTGTIVAPDTSVPFDESGSFTYSGRWEPGKVANTIDVSGWETVEGADNAPFSATSPTPLLEFTGIPTVGSTCDAETMELSNPESPFTTLWHRD